MVPSERSSLDLSEYTLFQIKKIFCIYKNQFLGEKLTFLSFSKPSIQSPYTFSMLATSRKYCLLMGHMNHVLCKGLKTYNRNMLTRSS